MRRADRATGARAAATSPIDPCRSTREVAARGSEAAARGSFGERSVAFPHRPARPGLLACPTACLLSSLPLRCLGDVVEDPSKLSGGHDRFAVAAHARLIDRERRAAVRTLGDLRALSLLGPGGCAPDERPVLGERLVLAIAEHDLVG